MKEEKEIQMALTREEAEDGDLTDSEVAIVTANVKAGLVSHLACHFCGMQFDVKKTRSFRAHIEEVHVVGDAGYLCGICCEEFTSRKAVENHMSTFHRAPKPLGCGTCGETFRVRNLLLKHIDSHSKEELENNKVGLCYCGECFEFFETVMALHTHSLTHKEQAVFVCGACGLQTQHRHIMVKHLETHVISNILNSSNNIGSTKQIKQKEPIEIDASRIEISHETYTTEVEDGSQDKRVLQVEDPDTSYRCGVCQASFTSLADALSHAEIHQETDADLVQTHKSEEISTLLPETTNVVPITAAHQ